MDSSTPVQRAAAAAALILLSVALLIPVAVWAQTDSQALAAQSLRGYRHVFIAYAVAWLLVFGWLFSVARRLARIERSLQR